MVPEAVQPDLESLIRIGGTMGLLLDPERVPLDVVAIKDWENLALS